MVQFCCIIIKKCPIGYSSCYRVFIFYSKFSISRNFQLKKNYYCDVWLLLAKIESVMGALDRPRCITGLAFQPQSQEV
ncbi:hypothetical protein MtrunA17_Chr7g0252471 [Medicago truncatula]|uniref:Uncharacterized protein n=1 Tax=Medicago truncatula TaxID=3880 RepID=A0A396H4G0_MEDTR|nr:hypothetical protein MtrunA17_Chr7g0252471 [Medicago truncatula]